MIKKLNFENVTTYEEMSNNILDKIDEIIDVVNRLSAINDCQTIKATITDLKVDKFNVKSLNNKALF